MRYRFFSTALAGLLTAFLASCGGSSGSSSPSLSGAVIDGYIEGATVCLDSNANNVCDAGELSAKTDSTGAYKLNTTGVNTTGLYLIVDIPDTAKDSDDAGKTLAEAGKSAYTMAATADQASVITPMTTLVVGKVKNDGLTIAAAKTKVLNELGLPSDTDLQEDHIKSGKELVKAAARQAASQLQEAQKAVPSDTEASKKFAAITSKLKTDATGLGALASATGVDLLNVPTVISDVANSKMMFYKMRSAKTGSLITASAMVFSPITTAPSSGWPIVVFGHGTTGIDKTCAPSNIMQAGGGYNYEYLVANMVKAGYVVVAPDYEGRGPASVPTGIAAIPNAHPYLHLSSAGSSMALAAVATKALLTTQVSGTWATVGHSQGGHAAIAGGQFSGLAKQLNSTMNYKGAVAIAPASHFSDSLDTLNQLIAAATSPDQYSAGYGYVANMNLYGSYVTKGSQYTVDPIKAENVFGTLLLNVHSTSSNLCLTPYLTAITSDIGAYSQSANAKPSGYAGVNVANMKVASVQRALSATEPGTAKVPGNTLIIQGSADTTVLPVITNKLVERMKLQNSTVSLQSFTDANATHSGVLAITEAQTAIFAHLATLFTAN